MKLFLTLAATSLAAPTVMAGSANIQGGGATWVVYDSFGTTNGLPSGGSCTTNVGNGNGASVSDASIAGQGDAFDFGVMMWIGRTQVGGTLTKTGNSVQFNSVSISGLDVQLKYDALQTSPTLRSYLTMTNPSDQDITVSFDYGNNFGSDGSTTIAGTSSGDLSFTTADSWIVTDDSSSSSGDPANLSVFYGPGSTLGAPDLVSQTVWSCSGTQGVRVRYDSVTIPAQSTRALMFFQEIHGTAYDALLAASCFPYNCDDSYFVGLTPGDLDRVLNWALGPSAPPSSSPTAVPTGTPTMSVSYALIYFSRITSLLFILHTC